MAERHLKPCYLCGEEAIHHEGYDTSRNIRVSCDVCHPYYVTNVALRFYLNRPDGKKLLDEADLKKLSKYVQEHYVDKPVLITADLIKAVTGKQSVSYR